jgi:ACS family hexuronate transporter-like MFS transporter
MTPSPALSPLRWWVCGLLLLATTLNYMDRMALVQTINTVKVELGLSDWHYGLLGAGFDVAFGVGTLVIGWLVDRVNARWVYPVVVAGWSVAGFVTGYADSFATLLAARFALGLFEAGNWPCGIRTTRTVLPPAERSFGNALFQSGTAIGAIVTPQLVLLIYGWADPLAPHRDPHLAAGGPAAVAATGAVPGVWATPFRLIGAIGVVWVLAWVLLVPGRLLPPPRPAGGGPVPPFAAVFRDRRYWILALLVVGVNTGWHTTQMWLPRLLKVQHGASIADVQWASTWFYLAADAGSWAVGLLTLFLAARGFDLFRVRRASFVACTALLAVAMAAVPAAGGAGLTLVLLAVGFAALGLFPTYFALSQEVSAHHQGKVTSTLGCINAAYMAGMKTAQGWVVEGSQRFDLLVAVAWVPAVLACLALLAWPRESRLDRPA